MTMGIRNGHRKSLWWGSYCLCLTQAGFVLDLPPSFSTNRGFLTEVESTKSKSSPTRWGIQQGLTVCGLLSQTFLAISFIPFPQNPMCVDEKKYIVGEKCSTTYNHGPVAYISAFSSIPKRLRVVSLHGTSRQTMNHALACRLTNHMDIGFL